MGGVPSGSKDRIAAVSSELLSRRGYNGMGLKAVSEAAELPFGSIYHHFPGGKEEIAGAAITSIGEVVGDLLRSLFASSETPEVALRAMFAFMAQRLERSDWTAGCSVGTPAQDGPSDSEVVRLACDDALGRMVGAVADGLTGHGVPRLRADELATTVIAAYEGATLMARVQRSTQPLDRTVEAMVGLVEFARR